MYIFYAHLVFIYLLPVLCAFKLNTVRFTNNKSIYNSEKGTESIDNASNFLSRSLFAISENFGMLMSKNTLLKINLSKESSAERFKLHNNYYYYYYYYYYSN